MEKMNKSNIKHYLYNKKLTTALSVPKQVGWFATSMLLDSIGVCVLNIFLWSGWHTVEEQLLFTTIFANTHIVYIPGGDRHIFFQQQSALIWVGDLLRTSDSSCFMKRSKLTDNVQWKSEDGSLYFIPSWASWGLYRFLSFWGLL